MQPVIIPAEKESEFDALMQEFKQLNGIIEKMSDQITATDPFPADLFDKMMQHQDRQIEIIEKIKSLGETP